MKTIALFLPRLGKSMLVALVTSGLLLSGSGLAWAERGGDRNRGQTDLRQQEQARGGQRTPPGQSRRQQQATPPGQYRQQQQHRPAEQYRQQQQSRPSGQYRQQQQSRPSGQYRQQQQSPPSGQYRQQQQSRPAGQYRQQQPMTMVRQLPPGHRKMVVRNQHYYVHNHRFYTHGPGGYMVVRPPVGAVVPALPGLSVRVSIGGAAYFRYDDVYYRPAPRGYIVVDAPRYYPAPVYSHMVKVWVSTLNLRSGPGTQFAVIGQTWRGQHLTVIGQAPGWYQVLLPGGGTGWVMSQYTRTLATG